MKNSWTRKEAAEITGLPDRRVLFYTEQFVLPGLYTPVGRGTARKYSLKHLFYLSVVEELNSLGLSLTRIRAIILALHTETLDFSNAPEIKKFHEPHIWVDGTLTKKPTMMVISIPQSPEEHVLSPDAKNYDSEVFLQVYTGSTKITLLVDRPFKIVINLNKIFNKLKL
ncbi:MAG: MerR family transcriptional regulator [Proteobacteria bacterium]|nr:MerR family transcriptional regulator [Pseudomonadota bacterium]